MELPLLLGLGVLAYTAKKVRQWATCPAAKRGPRMIICGAPGSGKGTQCDMIKEKYGVVHISTGDVLRAHVREGSELGLKAKAYMDRGELVPDDLIVSIIATEMVKPEVVRKGYLLDGVPRTKQQCLELDKVLGKPDVVIWLDVPDVVLEERVTGRRLDPVTGDIYHMLYKPPSDPLVLGRLIQRSDDTAEKLRTRLQMYHSNIGLVESHYQGMVAKVDGLKEPHDVFGDICRAVEVEMVKLDGQCHA